MSQRDRLEGAIEALEASFGSGVMTDPLSGDPSDAWAWRVPSVEIRRMIERYSAQLAAPPDDDGWLPIATMTEADAKKGVLRPHYAWGTMSVARNRHINREQFPWMQVSLDQTWPEESFLPFWRPLPAPPKGAL